MKGVNKFIFFLLTVSLLLTIICLFLSTKLTVLLLIPSFLILIIVAVPIFLGKNFDFFSPLPYLFYFLFLNVFIRTFYIINDFPDKEIINEIFLMGNDKEFLFAPTIILLFGFLVTVIGYMAKPIAIKKNSAQVEIKDWGNTRFNVFILVAMIIALTALYKFISVSIQSLFLLSAENISSYRGVADDLSEYSSNGYLRLLIQFSDIVFYLTFVRHLVSKKKSKFNFSILILSFLTSIFFYFFVQSRTSMLMLIINPLILRYYLTNKRINIFGIVVLGIFCLSLLGFITSMRAGSGYEKKEFDITYPVKALDPLIVNNGGVDVSKTGHIINYVNKNESFKFGGTFTWIFIAWIPRQFWPAKPVNIDTEIGMKIYGAQSYGTGAVPPGYFGELYWNFWYIGIFVGCWLVGWFLKNVHNYFIAKNRGINDVIMYVICFMPVGLGIYGSSINSTVAGILFTILPLYLALKFITKRKKGASDNLDTTSSL